MYQRRDFYRHARYVHGWLSAFAFIALFFFALTGLLLNHTDWFKSSHEEQTQTLTLPKALLVEISKQENPSDELLKYIRSQQSIVGRYQSSEVMDGEVMIHLESPAGVTDVWAMLDSGEVEITTKAADTVSLIKDLHRGKNSGLAWSWFIDIASIVILILSVAGFILFLSIKSRLITHLALTALSLAVFVVLIWTVV